MKFISNKNLLLLLLIITTSSSIYGNTRRYRLSLRDDASTTIVIGWEQNGGSGAQVYYGTVDQGQNWASYPFTHGVDRSVTASGMDNSFARLTGLSPNTIYYFVIKDSDGVSPRFWFKTTPFGNSIPLSVVAGGDSRAYLDDSPREAANLMVSRLRPDLVFFGGDYTWLSTSIEWSAWMDDWQLTTTADGKMVAGIWERGNHELSGGIVYDLFDVPNPNEYYALSIGGSFIRFYTLNTEISMLGNQASWLQNDLIANHASHDWNIVQYHTCMRPHTTEKSNGDEQYNAWAQLFHQYRVQLVVESDAHDVKTTWPVKPSTGPNSEDGFELDSINGTVYIGEGCWGAPLRTNDNDKSWTRNSGSFNSFHWLKIGRDTIEVRTIATDNAASVGSVTDSDRFTPPSGINIWNPSNGNVVYIVNQKYIDRPEIEVTFPFQNQYFAQPQNITITANASDVSGVISQVKFFINDVQIGQDVTAPYSLNYTIPANGEYVITAWAVNGDGWHNVSDDVKIYAGEVEITASLLSNDDDAEENKDGGSVDLTSSDLELCIEDLVWPLSDNDQWVGLRFAGLEIPKNAFITSAYIQFTSDESQTGASNLIIYQENTANASAFVSAPASLSARQKLSTTIPWAPGNWSSDGAGTNERTPELKTMVQQIVNHPNWTIGNAMAFLFEGSGTKSAYSRDSDVGKSAKLIIKFTYESHPVGIQESENNSIENITLYPNPTTSIVRVDVNHSNPFTIEVFSLNGQLVYRADQQMETTLINFEDLQLNKGVYLIKIGNQTKKVLYH
jgi:hypothetical protein